MLLALALMLTAPDHWPAFVTAGHAHDHASHGASNHAESEQHARHCHGDAATCSDLPLTTVFGLAALAAWLAFGLPGTTRPCPAFPAPRWRSRSLSVPHPPPRPLPRPRHAFA